MKICTKCGKSKLRSDFAKKSAAHDKLSPWCKSCFSELASQKYRSSSTERDRKSRNRQLFTDKNRALLLTYLMTHPCIDCGITDVRVLEFDHRDPTTKKFNVSDMLSGYSWSTIEAEIEKCDVRCANHHRIRTVMQYETWRILY